MTREHTPDGRCICDRCHQVSYMFRMSWFNTDMICKNCQTKEQAHPLYQEAKQAVYEHEKQGNKNWEGIGLPEDLKVNEW